MNVTFKDKTRITMPGISITRVAIGLGIGRAGGGGSDYWTNKGAVVFGFDNALQTVFDFAEPLFTSRGKYFTVYANGNTVGGDDTYFIENPMSWANLLELDAKGYDVQDHLFVHTAPFFLSENQLIQSLYDNNITFLNHGLKFPTELAYPGAELIIDAVVEIVKKYRNTGRVYTAYPFDYIQKNTSRYRLPQLVIDAANNSAVQDAKDCIDYCVLNNTAIFLTSHSVSNAAVENLYTTLANLTEILDYAITSGISIITQKQLSKKLIPSSEVEFSDFVPIFNDLFSDNNGVRLNAHIPNVGGIWTEVNGIWEILNNKVTQTQIAPAQYNAIIDTGKADVNISQDVTIIASGNTSTGITFRYVDSSHKWVFIIDSYLGGQNVLLIGVGGGQTVDFNTPIIVNQTYVLRVSTIGDLITCYINGKQVIQVTNSFNNTATKHGIHYYIDGLYLPSLIDNYVIKEMQ